MPPLDCSAPRFAVFAIPSWRPRHHLPGPRPPQVPPRMVEAFHELYGYYKAAVTGSGVPGADGDFVARVMAAVCERVMLELNPATAYTFPSYHTRIQEPYNYYAFGQRYIRCVRGVGRGGVGGDGDGGQRAKWGLSAASKRTVHKATSLLCTTTPTAVVPPYCRTAGGSSTSSGRCWAGPSALQRSSASWRQVGGRMQRAGAAGGAAGGAGRVRECCALALCPALHTCLPDPLAPCPTLPSPCRPPVPPPRPEQATM